MLDKICGKKRGMKKDLINSALRAFLQSEKIVQFAKKHDKQRKVKREAERKRILGLLKN